MNLDALKKYYNPDVEEDDTLKRIYSFLKDKYNQPINYVQKPGHKPSDLGSKCFRKLYYAYYKVAKDTRIDAKGARIFETGNYYEDMVMSWFTGMDEHIPYRNLDGSIPKNRFTGELNPQFPISSTEWRIPKGYIDNVAVVKGELWLYEVKSCASFKYQDLTEPMDDHKVQTAIYFKTFNDHLKNGDYKHILELDGHEAAVGIKIMYINKDTSDIKLFITRTELLNRQIQLLDKKIGKANEFIDLKSLPPKTEDKCTYCSFAKKCKKDWNEV